MRNACQALVSCLLLVQVWEGLCQEEVVCGKTEYMDDSGQCMPCTKCLPGKEPDGSCGFGVGSKVACRPCAPGTFSSRYGLSPCSMYTQCDQKKRVHLRAGTPSADAVCGDCIPRHFPLVPKSPNLCVACWLAPPDTVGCEGERTLRPRAPRTLEAASNADKASQNSTHKGVPEDSRTQYAVLAIVPVFCMMGLTGIFLCNLLKKKGYRCTSHKPDEEAIPEKEGINPSILLEENGNEDTIGVLVRLITEKKENAVALEELLKEYQSKQVPTIGNKSPQKMHLLPQMPNICKHQHHLHTVQGLGSRSGICCTRCSQKKWPDVLTTSQSANNIKSSRNGFKCSRSGEITILSVGRFRVARIPEQKTNPPELNAISEVGGGDGQDVPSSEPPEQRVLLCETVRTKNHSLEDTSKLEDVI
ncbi:PREDICTED: tumor necrosis factor receptor superfamily member 19L isoform X2 [Nanorana parkeri]|uniref:tumor necrosis factor receptor superfamily member 19L isoform X2 n=1 Tax=Nanorana parkeri TaxID=125878 RepID=UPI000854BEFC|nr:PREDICTED: tumor necrosis factor receptor superfamily member 19L isoform X2 [Nanorana parkeri]